MVEYSQYLGDIETADTRTGYVYMDIDIDYVRPMAGTWPWLWIFLVEIARKPNG